MISPTGLRQLSRNRTIVSQYRGLLVFALFLLIVGLVPFRSTAESENNTEFPLKVLRLQATEHRPLWTRQQRLALIETVRLAFEETTPSDMLARVQALIRFFPSYLMELPGQIITEGELDFLCNRTKWHIERFLSTPLPTPEGLSELRSQVESILSIIQDEDLDSTIVIRQVLKEKARHILLETVTKVAQNPLVPVLKRSLTVQELTTAKADILKWFNATKTSPPATLNEDELSQWYLNRISVVIQVIDAKTKPDAPQALIEMEQEYLRLAGVREQFKEGHGYFQSILAPSMEHIEFMEILLREWFGLHTAVFATEFQSLIGY